MLFDSSKIIELKREKSNFVKVVHLKQTALKDGGDRTYCDILVVPMNSDGLETRGFVLTEMSD